MGAILSALGIGILFGYWVRPHLDRGLFEDSALRAAERMARLRSMVYEQERPIAGDWAVMHRLREGISRTEVKNRKVTKPIPLEGRR